MSKNKFDPATEIQSLKQFGEFGDVNPSITDSATYTFLGAETMTDTFHGETEGCFLYSRHWNPSNKYLSDALAAMEGTPVGWVTSSGMAAITMSILQVCKTGDHIVSSVTTYGGTFAFLKNWLPRYGIDVTFVYISDLESVRAAMRPNTKLIYTETITNPLLQVSDIPALSEIAHKHGAKLLIDNTFSPMVVSPYRLGADIVVHSLTKFINGKNDCVAGAICSDSQFIESLIDVNNGTAMLLGPVLDPMRSMSILKNMHTLHIRMQQHSRNASYLAARFKEKGVPVTFPGSEDHPDYHLLKSMVNEGYGFSGMLSIDMITKERAYKCMEGMQNRGVGYLAVSLGYFKTLFSNSGSSTSSEVPEEVQMKMGLSEGLIRFSAGLDHDIDNTWALIEDTLNSL
jgi:methionine-gamma-lyase